MKTFINAYKENQVNLSLLSQYNEEMDKDSNNEENEDEIEEEKGSNKV